MFQKLKPTTRFELYILLLFVIILFSCEINPEIRLVKNQKLISASVLNLLELSSYGFDLSNYKDITTADLYTEIALLINGKVEYKSIDLSKLESDYKDYLEDKYPLSKFVLAKVYNKNNTTCLITIYSVNTRLNSVEVVEGYIKKDDESLNGYLFNYRLLGEYAMLKMSKEYRDSYNNIPLPIKKNDICYVTSDLLNVRSSPEVGNNRIGTIKRGTKIQVIDVVDDSWVKIKLSNGEGYVASEYLSNVEERDNQNAIDKESSLDDLDPVHYQ